MSRKQVQDIHSESEAPRSIRQISIEKKKPRVEATTTAGPKPLQERSIHARRASSKGLWFIAGIAVVFLFFAFSLIFSGAEIVTYPKELQAQLDASFEASQNPSDETQITYKVMTLTKEGFRDVPATGEVFKEEPASGVITIFNDYSTQEQRLIKNTRFESPDGLIYRIRESIVVPGQTKDSQGNTVPGSLDVKVYADETGTKYNIGKVDFTVPGFKGTPQFATFYARAKTDMTGGFSGTLKTIDENTREVTVKAIQDELREALFAEATAQVPEGFVIYNDGMLITTNSLLNEEVDSGTVKIKEQATLEALMFDEKELSKFIARQATSDYDGGDVLASSLKDLSFALIGKESVNLGNSSPVTFTLKGDTRVVWTYDEVALKEAFLGKKKADIDTILTSFKGIERAEVVMRPFWKRTFPEKASRINVVNASVGVVEEIPTE